MRSITLAVAAAALSVPVMAVPAAPAMAATGALESVTGQSDASKFQRGRYDRNGNYVGPTWRGRDGRYRCRRSNGTTGLLIGGAAGAVIGNQVAGRGDHLLGTVIGGAVGAIAGREIDRSDSGYRDNRGRRCR